VATKIYDGSMRFIKLVVASFIVVGVCLLWCVRAQAAPLTNGVVNDVSWPNCNASHTSLTYFGIVGVNGGLDFRLNPCLAKETAWFGRYGLYINTGYPGDSYGRKYMNSPMRCGYSDSQCLSYNYGFNAALNAINYANSQLVSSTSWWLDVETDNSWTNDYLINRANLEGALSAVKQRTFLSTVGFYSSRYQWDSLTNNWNNLYPEWVATGGTSEEGAEGYCLGQSFTGGRIWLSQYTTVFDDNVICSGDFSASLSKLL
jgi:hypothetical protein